MSLGDEGRDAHGDQEVEQELQQAGVYVESVDHLFHAHGAFVAVLLERLLAAEWRQFGSAQRVSEGIPSGGLKV